MPIVTESKVPGYNCKKGKVRDVYDIGDKLIIIATDRLSAFDVVLLEGVPLKGIILNKITKFWLMLLGDLAQPNHFISIDLSDFPKPFQRTDFEGRAMLCWKADRVVPFECIVRGYLAGSGYKDYKKTGCICGIKLPEGLRECEKLPEPIFTPSTKAESGHDENVSFQTMRDKLSIHISKKLRDWSLALYQAAHDFALSRGIIIADTKFEFGIMDSHLMLIDEVLTPDSSRFWPVDGYTPGKTQPSFDKQPVRDFLQELCNQGKWDKQPPAPSLPEDLINSTSKSYLKIYSLLNGRNLQ